MHKPAHLFTPGSSETRRKSNAKPTQGLIDYYAAQLGVNQLIPIGTLPFRAHGILLLTNDGELSRLMEHPASNMQSIYTYRVRPAVSPALAQQWCTQGIRINGALHRNFEFAVSGYKKSRYVLKIKVRGTHAPPHVILQQLGRKVIRGGRTSYGPFSLRGLHVGGLREVSIPLKFAQIVNKWQPFIDRDWPYFRAQRLNRLKKLSYTRHLTPKERSELDSHTFEQLCYALQDSPTRTEPQKVHNLLESESARITELMKRRNHTHVENKTTLHSTHTPMDERPIPV